MEEIRFKKRHSELLHTLVRTTHFNYDEVESLFLIYLKITKLGPIDRKRFREILHQSFQMTEEVLMDRIFSYYDKQMHQELDLENWVQMLSLFMRGSLEEKIDYCFSIYNIMKDGFLVKDTIVPLMRGFLVREADDDDVDGAVRDMVEVVVKKLDLDRDGKVSYNDYRQSVLRNPMLLEAFGPCLPTRPALDTFLTTFTPHVHFKCNAIK